MNKVILYALFVAVSISKVHAQCPPSIIDGGNGATYVVVLANLAQCANFPLDNNITLNGAVFSRTNCSMNFGVTAMNISNTDETPILLSTSAPIAFTFATTTCMYNSSGQLIVLPVELTTFTAQAIEGRNLLYWATASEVNNKGFQVERLMDNGQWIMLGFVNAKGKAASYDFTDNTPLSTSYYRLRQIDNDGKETLSKVVSVVAKGNNKLKVYPNPVSNVLTIETSVTGTYDIFNLLGQVVLNGKTHPSGAGGLDVSALPQGTYFLKIGEEQVKFVKQ